MQHQEGNILFEFEDQYWWIIHADDCPDYKKIDKAIDNTKSCDFVGYYLHPQVPTLMEVKDFRTLTPQTTSVQDYVKKLDNLLHNIPQKVRDTLSMILNGSRNSTHYKMQWENWTSCFNDNQSICYIIIWIEHNNTQLRLLNGHKRLKHKVAHFKRDMKKKLAWIFSASSILFLDHQRQNNLGYQGFHAQFV